MSATFSDTGLSQPLSLAAADQAWLTPTPIQREAIPAILRGADVWAEAPTGSGKTAAFALPLLHRLQLEPPRRRGCHVRTLILSPTRELAVQTAEAFRALSRDAGTYAKVVALHGGVSINPQLRSLAGGADVLVATPGRLLDVLENNGCRLEDVSTVLLDEADRLLAKEFSFELDHILERLPPTTQRQTLLFSATFPYASRPRAARLLQPQYVRLSSEGSREGAFVSPGTAAAAEEMTPPAEASETTEARGERQRQRRPASNSERYGNAPPPATIEQRAIRVDVRERTPLLRHLLDTEGWARCLVFTGSQRSAEHVANKLRAAGYDSEALHGGLTQEVCVTARHAMGGL